MPRAPEGRLCVLSHDPTSSAFNAMAVRVNGFFYFYCYFGLLRPRNEPRAMCVFFLTVLRRCPNGNVDEKFVFFYTNQRAH